MAFSLPKKAFIKKDVLLDAIKHLFMKLMSKRNNKKFLYITIFIAVVTFLATAQAALNSNKNESTIKTYNISANGSVSRGVISRSDFHLMSMVIEGEAADEPLEGKTAVGAVIINRMESGDFPNSIRGVIYQPLAFEAVANGQYTRPVSKESMQAAEIALQGYDPTNGALYYWNPDKAKSSWIWQKPVSMRIGHYVFAH